MFGRKQLTSVYIVDDNSDAIEVLRRMLESQYSVKVIGTSTDADTAIEEIIQLAPDLIFTDVEMPTMTGIQLCQLLHQEVDPNTKVVFYTGHNKYMIDAIRQKAFDYLLKPPSPQDLAQTMTRFYEDKLASLPQAAGPAEQRQPRILVVNAMNEHIALRDADVAFFRFDADGKHWEAVCTNGSTYILRSRTNSDFILRYSPSFVQIHKRYIVNVSHIMMIQDNTYILGYPYEDNRELKVSKNYRRDLMDAFYTL